LKLIFKNFRGIREGSIDLKNLNILIGGNNSGKTTVLEGLFLIPNPLRYVPYGTEERAVSVLSSLHATLGSEAYVFLFHNYSGDLASIYFSNESEVETVFQRKGDSIEVYMKEGAKAYYIGGLSGESKKVLDVNILLEVPVDPTGRMLQQTMMRTNIGASSFVSKNVGETVYFHPLLMKSIWEYFRNHWVEFRNRGLTSKVAKMISEGITEEYDDLLLEPFIGGQQAIYVRTKDARGIRLGDLGSGVQVLATLMLLQEFVKPKILLIDDMESHMNPSLMMHAASWFGEILEKGSKIVISTHSLEAAKFIAGALEEHEPQITLLALRDGILSSKNLSLDEVENLEKAGIDVRVSGGILL